MPPQNNAGLKIYVWLYGSFTFLVTPTSNVRTSERPADKGLTIPPPPQKKKNGVKTDKQYDTKLQSTSHNNITVFQTLIILPPLAFKSRQKVAIVHGVNKVYVQTKQNCANNTLFCHTSGKTKSSSSLLLQHYKLHSKTLKSVDNLRLTENASVIVSGK